MKNTTVLLLIGILIFVVGGFVFIKAKSVNIEGNEGQIITGEMQQVVLSQDGYNYKDTIAEAGRPLSISADSSVGGCLRSVVFNVKGKKYSKYLKSPQDTLQLPALSKGTYTFSCSMGMGYGKLVVN